MSFIGFGGGVATGPASGLRFAQTRGRIQGGSMQGVNYPSPFFDVAHTYLPVTVKQLFKWCRYYFLTNPLINATVFKLSEYPITDIVVEHEDSKVERRWSEYLHDHLRINAFRVEAGLDFFAYGNSCVSIGYPFKKYLFCRNCKFRDAAGKIRANWIFTNFQFRMTCPRCGFIGDATPQDMYYKNASGIKTIRWNPEDIEITYNDITGEYTHFYTIPAVIRNDIVIGRKDVVEGIPQVFIQAMRESKGVIFSKDNFFHMRRPTLATQDRGWGTPLLLPVLKDVFYLQIMKKAQEAILLEHIVPLRILFPQAGSGTSDVYTTVNLVDWRDQVAAEIARWRHDNNYIPILPLPIGNQSIGGDGRSLLLTQEIQAWSEQIMVGMSVPREFLMGGLCLSPNSLVFTDHGLERLSEIRDADGVCRRVVSHDGIRVASELHQPGRKRVVRVRTRSGLLLDGATTHKLLVLREDLSQEFVPVGQLRGGEYVGVKVGANLWPTDPPALLVSLRKVGGRFANVTLDTVTLPDVVTPELARILGYLVAEGACASERRISFSNTDRVLFDDFLACVKQVFNLTLGVSSETYDTVNTPSGQNTIYKTEISRQTVVEFLRGLGLSTDAYGKTVPVCIRKSPKVLVAQFLRAYFDGDGGVSTCRGKLGVAAHSVSRELLQEVQLLLLNMGIVSSLYESYVGKSTCTLQVRSEHARLYYSEVGFTAPIKQLSAKEGFSVRAPGNRSNTVPYVRAALLAAKARHTVGDGAWRHEPLNIALNQAEYTVEEVAALLQRERSSVSIYIRKGLLPARVEAGVAGRFSRHLIAADDLQHFMQTHGVGRRRAFRVRQYEYGYDTLAETDLPSVRDLEPELYERIQVIQKQAFFWDEVVSIEEMEFEEEMLDLGVEDAHSYQANGILGHNSYAGTNVSMRMLENQFLGYVNRQKQLVRFLVKQISAFLGWPEVKIRFKPFKMADDLQRKAYLFQLNQANKISDTTLLAESDLSQEEENGIMIRETATRLEATKKQQTAMAEIQGEAQLIMMKYQAKGQEVMMQAQAAPQAPGEPGGPESQLAGGAPGGEQATPGTETPALPGQDPMAALPQPAPAGQTPQDFLTQVSSQLTGSQRMNGGPGGNLNVDLPSFAMAQAKAIAQMPQQQQEAAVQNLQLQSPELASLVKSILSSMGGGGGGAQSTGVDQRPMPEQRPPRRANPTI